MSRDACHVMHVTGCMSPDACQVMYHVCHMTCKRSLCKSVDILVALADLQPKVCGLKPSGCINLSHRRVRCTIKMTLI